MFRIREKCHPLYFGSHLVGATALWGFFENMTTTKFVHLHNHSYYSLLDGAISIDSLIMAARRNNMHSLALTDHGNLLGAIEFYDKAIKNGIKPVIGCEMYLAPTNIEVRDRKNHHIVLLVKDKLGYKNLLRLVSISFLKGFYYKPRIDKNLLMQYSKGLICLSACLNGEIPFCLKNDDITMARRKVEEYISIFGESNFYLEIQKHNILEEDKVNNGLIQLSKEQGVPVVATNDVHYLNKEDSRIQEVLLSIQTLKKLSDKDRFKFRGENYHFKTYAEMLSDFPEIPSAPDESVAIAGKCNLSISSGKYFMPHYQLPNDFTSDFDYLDFLVKKEINALFNDAIPETYNSRIESEMQVIKQMGFSSYFLIVSDFINYAKANNIMVGPGRGSAAGSLVSYVLGITEVDPIKYDLIFERFLNVERISMPDIDTDVEDIHRKDIISYLSRHYGEGHVAAICTFTRLMTRRAIRDVGRVLDIPIQKIDKILLYLPENIDLKEFNFTKNPQILDIAQNDSRIKELFDFSKKIVGFPRNVSTHAAGIVIAPGDYQLVDIVPLMNGKSDEVVTQYDMDSLGKIGVLKIDILANSNLTIISETISLIKSRTNTRIDLKKLPMDDKQTLALFQKADTDGIFQFDEPGIQNLMKDLNINKFEDIVHLLALYRPGPLKSGLATNFIERKKGIQKVEYLHPLLAEILSETYGVILYQEQVMNIANKLAGFSMSKADELRKAMGKKTPAVMAALRDEFIDGAITRKIPRDIANKIFEQISFFAGYGFNKAHSVAYAFIAYRAGYLKSHFFTEYWVSVLNYTVEHKPDNLAKHISEAKHKGVNVLAPNVNKSSAHFSIEKNNVRFGLGSVKNVGYLMAQRIVDTRVEKGDYTDLYDFIKKMRGFRLTNRIVESLIKAGALDFTGEPRAQLATNIEEMFKSVGFFDHSEVTGQESLFDEKSFSPVIADIKVEEWADTLRYEYEREMLGVVLSGDPLRQYRILFQLLKFTVIESLNAGRRYTIAGILHNISYKTGLSKNKIARARLSDLTSTAEIVFNQSQFHKLKDGGFLVVEGAPAHTETQEMHKIFAQAVFSADEFLKIFVKKVVIEIDANVSIQDLRNLKKIIDAFPGTVPIYFSLKNNKKTDIRIKSDKVLISPTFTLIKELNSVPFIHLNLMRGQQFFKVSRGKDDKLNSK